MNSSNIDTLWDNVLWRDSYIEVRGFNITTFSGSPTFAQKYGNEFALGVLAEPMSFWASYYNFVNADIRIQGTSLKQWIKNNLTPKNGGGWA